MNASYNVSLTNFQMIEKCKLILVISQLYLLTQVSDDTDY